MLPLLIPLITTLAPYAARVIGGALGGKRGQEVAAEFEPVVTNLAIRTFGTDDVVRMEERARADPAKAQEFAKEITGVALQMQAQVRIAEIAAEVEATKADVANVQGAREHQQKLIAAGSLTGWAPTFISAIVVFGFFGVLALMITRPFQIGEGGENALEIMLGALTIAFGAVINYWLGSTAGSRAKDTALADQASRAVEGLRDRPFLPQPAPSPLPLPAPAPPVVVMPPVAPAPQPAPAPQSEPDVRPSRFIGLIGHILKAEGGYSEHPADPGGATNFGITHRTLADWRGAPVTPDDVRALTVDEAKSIFFAKYWSPMGCDQLPPGVDLVCFDMAENAGVRRAALLLQGVLKRRDPSLEVDGVVGPLTLAAAARVPPLHVINEFHEARMEFYRSLPTFETFGRGWTSRAERVLALARAEAMAGPGQVAA